MFPSVWYIEAETDLRIILKEILNDQFSMTCFSTPERAVKNLAEGALPPNLILTDLLFSEIVGIEVIRLLRAHLPVTPLIVVSALSEEDVVPQIQEGCIAAWIEKPYQVDHLAATMKRALVKSAS